MPKIKIKMHIEGYNYDPLNPKIRKCLISQKFYLLNQNYVTVKIVLDYIILRVVSYLVLDTPDYNVGQFNITSIMDTCHQRLNSLL